MNAPDASVRAELRWHAALTALGQWLEARGYRFITPTPATHERVLRRPAPDAATLRDAFGWSLPFAADLLPRGLHDELRGVGLLVSEGTAWRSQVRFSCLEGLLMAHSAYPTLADDAVFFGPDTYRFARWISQVLADRPLEPGARILDIGCGSGAGGLHAARCASRADAGASELVLADINPSALAHARANAALARRPATFCQSDLYARVDGEFDLIVANPPYLVDDRQRIYRNGGGPLGGELSQRMLAEGLARLAPGGRFVLYTGAAIADGHDAMRDAVARIARAAGTEPEWTWRYEELDPDVFGEELQTPAYARCDRIAAVGAVVQRPRP